MLDTPYVLLPILAATVLFVLAAFGFRARHVPGALPFGIAMLLAGIQDLSYALELGFSGTGVPALARQLCLPTLTGLPVSLFWMALEYTGRRG